MTKAKKIKFYVVEHLNDNKSSVFPHICLIHRDWDDWFQYQTTYVMWYISDPYSKEYVGTIKIGEKGMEGAPRDFDGNLLGSRIPKIEKNFENDDLKRNLKKITEDKEEIILTANDEKDNIIILSLDKYNQLIKDIENAKYLAKLDLAYEQMIIDKKMNEEIAKGVDND